MEARWSIVNRAPNQAPGVSVGKVTLQLSQQGEQVVLDERYSTYSGGTTDFRLLGNGLRFDSRGVGQGDVILIEYYRTATGEIRGLQRYKGLPSTVVVYDQVPVPPELKAEQENKIAQAANAGQVAVFGGVAFAR